MFRSAILSVGLMLASMAASADVRILFGFPPGTVGDTMGRLIAGHMTQTLGETVNVENKPGASGRIAAETVKSAAPDGKTLLLGPISTMALYPHVYAGQMTYNPLKDFVPLAHLADTMSALTVNARVPAKTLAEYVALVKKNPSYGFYGSAGAGSVTHFLGVMLANSAGVDLVHVPYKGIAPAVQALVGGETPAAVIALADVDPFAKSGQVRILATSGLKREASHPDVPTFIEGGVNISAVAWYGLFAPAGTPPALAARLSNAAIAALKDPAIRKRLVEIGAPPTAYGPEELDRIMREDYSKWGPIIKASGFKPGV
jgi:tripartite-type tricarboxylate transporter receptor subunit TctC